MAVTINAITSNPISSQLDVYKRRIRRERRLRYLAMAFAGVSAVWAIFVLLDPAPPVLLPVCLALTVALPVASLAFEANRRPSDAETARLLDNLLDNQQRLTTSVELLSEGKPSLMTQAQLSSTESILARIDPKILYPVRMPWPAVALSVGLLLFALSIMLLKGGSSFTAFQPGQLPPDQSAVGAVQSPTPASGLPESGLTPTTEPAASQPTAVGTPEDGQGSADPAAAASQAAASQQAQADLDRLGKALDGQGATQGAADSLRQGSYDAAAKQLSELGEQNDQLSPNAKQDLAGALEQAASDTQSDSALRDAERRAADALRNGDYKQIEEAMKDLGNAVQQTAGNVIPQQELAQSFPENSDQNSSQSSQGEQSNQQSQQSGQTGQNGQNGQQNQSEGQSGQSGQSGQQGMGGADGQQGQNEQQGDQSQQGDSAGGGEGSNRDGQGTAPGDGHRVSGPVDPSRPNSKSNPFELEGQGNPDNTRPVDKSDNPALTLEGTASSGAASSPGSGSRSNTPGESNNMPVDRWAVIQRYFGHDRK